MGNKIRHIALTTENPSEIADFYKEAFEMQEVGRTETHVFLSDGYMNLTILKWKTEKDRDVGPMDQTTVASTTLDSRWMIWTRLVNDWQRPRAYL